MKKWLQFLLGQQRSFSITHSSPLGLRKVGLEGQGSSFGGSGWTGIQGLVRNILAHGKKLVAAVKKRCLGQNLHNFTKLGINKARVSAILFKVIFIGESGPIPIEETFLFATRKYTKESNVQVCDCEHGLSVGLQLSVHYHITSRQLSTYHITSRQFLARIRAWYYSVGAVVYFRFDSFLMRKPSKPRRSYQGETHVIKLQVNV